MTATIPQQQTTGSTGVMTILFCIDDNYWPHLSAAIASLTTSNPAGRLRIIVCSSSRSPENEQRIRIVASNVEFIHYEPPPMVLPTGRYLTLATYLRLFMTEYLDSSIDKVLYLDPDMIVCRDLGSLWSIDLGTGPVGAVPEPYPVPKELGFVETDRYFNAGTLLVNLRQWRAENALEKFLSYIADNQERLFACDQDALNGVFRGRIKALDYAWNFHAPYADLSAEDLRITKADLRELRANPGIVHFAGPAKPWRRDYEPHYKQLYRNAISGTPWSAFSAKSESELRLRVRERLNWYFPSLCRRVRKLMGKRGRLELTRDGGALLGSAG